MRFGEDMRHREDMRRGEDMRRREDMRCGEGAAGPPCTEWGQKGVGACLYTRY